MKVRKKGQDIKRGKGREEEAYILTPTSPASPANQKGGDEASEGRRRPERREGGVEEPRPAYSHVSRVNVAFQTAKLSPRRPL